MALPLQVHPADRLTAAQLARAHKAWNAGASNARMRELLECRSDWLIYATRDRLDWKPRPAAVRLRLQHAPTAYHRELQADVQPLEVHHGPERRCTGCLGYTDTASCHRCGAPA